MGALNLFFYVTAITTLLNGFLPFALNLLPSDSELAQSEEGTTAEPSEPELVEEIPPIQLHIFYILMPIATIVYHLELSRVCQKSEHRLGQVLKIILILIYYAVIISTQFVERDTIELAYNATQVITSIILILYTYGIFNWRIC